MKTKVIIRSIAGPLAIALATLWAHGAQAQERDPNQVRVQEVEKIGGSSAAPQLLIGGRLYTLSPLAKITWGGGNDARPADITPGTMVILKSRRRGEANLIEELTLLLE